mgnify:FL=1
MKLQQGQVWVKEKDSYRITEWARMTIQYKHSHKAKFKESDVIEVSKKEFCRLIKGAVLEESED